MFLRVPEFLSSVSLLRTVLVLYSVGNVVRIEGGSRVIDATVPSQCTSLNCRSDRGDLMHVSGQDPA